MYVFQLLYKVVNFHVAFSKTIGLAHSSSVSPYLPHSPTPSLLKPFYSLYSPSLLSHRLCSATPHFLKACPTPTVSSFLDPSQIPTWTHKSKDSNLRFTYKREHAAAFIFLGWGYFTQYLLFSSSIHFPENFIISFIFTHEYTYIAYAYRFTIHTIVNGNIG